MNKLELIKKKIASEYAENKPTFPKPLMKRKKVKKNDDLINFLEENAETNDFANYGNFSHFSKKILFFAKFCFFHVFFFIILKFLINLITIIFLNRHQRNEKRRG